MLLFDLVGFVVSAFVMVKAGSYAVKFASKIAKADKISAFVTSFLLVGLVSSFPEAFVSVVSAFKHVPSLGLGTLLGSTVADLSIILGLIGVAAGKIHIHKKEFAHDLWLVGMVMLPILLAMDGKVSRLDGIILIGACMLFIANMLEDDNVFSKIASHPKKTLLKYIALFTVSSAVVFTAANFIVKFAEGLSADFRLPLMLVGVVFAALITALPELVFSLNAVRYKMGDLAVGDIFGSVIIDATLLVGLVAIISPISVAGVNIVNIAVFTLLAVAATLYFLEPGKIFTRREGILMVLLYVIFIVMEMATSLPHT